MKKKSENTWGMIRKRSVGSQAAPWVDVEECSSQQHAEKRVIELHVADQSHDYAAEAYLELPIWISKKSVR